MAASEMPLLAIGLDQLEPGSLRVERTTIPFPGLTLRRTRLNLGIRATGTVAQDATLVALPGDEWTNARWDGAAFGQGNMASSHSRVDLLSRGPATFYTMAVEREAVPREFLTFDPARAKRLRRYLERLITIADLQGPSAVQAAGRSVLTFLSLLCDDESGRRQPVARRVAAVRRCEEYVLEHIADNPTLADLCSVAGLAARSLINAFHAVTGYSPMAYLKAQRLNAVHRELCQSDYAKTRIIDVATNWGFWHMGHFTADYRAMFGETPSQTLRK